MDSFEYKRGNTMYKFLYFIILSVISFTLVFSQAKQCCKNKVNKGKVSCKFNQANIYDKGDKIEAGKGIQLANTTGTQYPINGSVISVDQKRCGTCINNAPWWKFWAKKKNCCNTKT